MLYKNVGSQKLAVFAWDTNADAPKTGDAANITAQISKDGGASAATNDVNPTELDATNHKGVYIFDLTQAETNADMIVLSGVSATANVVIEPIQALTTPGTNAALLADAVQISGDAAAADALESALDGGGATLTVTVSGNVTGSVASVTGAVGSVTGAVGSVTGNVGGNVVGSVASVAGNVGGNVQGNVAGIGTGAITSASFAAGAIDSSAIAANAIGASQLAPDCVGASELAADAVTEIQNGLATAASQTAILNRLGAWAGSGLNTVLGAFRALFRNDADATVPSDINADLGGGAGTASNTTHSAQAIRARGDAAWVTATGFLDAAGVRAAVGLAAANLDTQLAAINTAFTNGSIVLHADYDPAKTAAQAGDQMDLVDAPNATAITAIQAGLSTLTAAAVNAEVLNVINTQTLVDGFSIAQAMRLMAAGICGITTGAGGATETFKGLDKATTRLTATITGANRSDFTYNAA